MLTCRFTFTLPLCIKGTTLSAIQQLLTFPLPWGFGPVPKSWLLLTPPPLQPCLSTLIPTPKLTNRHKRKAWTDLELGVPCIPAQLLYHTHVASHSYSCLWNKLLNLSVHPAFEFSDTILTTGHKWQSKKQPQTLTCELNIWKQKMCMLALKRTDKCDTVLCDRASWCEELGKVSI